MCGFAGYYGAGDFNREEVIDQMGERIAHRGPDSKGSFVDDYVALGFRRLSIIDLEGGSQPIHSADGKHVIIFNGEIYNYQEIRKELIEKHINYVVDVFDKETKIKVMKPQGTYLIWLEFFSLWLVRRGFTWTIETRGQGHLKPRFGLW